MRDHEKFDDTSADAISVDGETGLETGQIGRSALVSLSLSSFLPAVGMALAPFLLYVTVGPNAWLPSVLAMIATICVGKAIIVFAQRYVATGSLYSYIGEVFGRWAVYVVGASLLAGFIVATGSLISTVGVFAGSFLSSVGLSGAMGTGPQVIILVVAVLAAAAVALRGLDTSVLVAVTLTVVSIPLLVVITIASVVHNGIDLSAQMNMSGVSISAIFTGMAFGVAPLLGFESCAALAIETENPKKSVPVAVMAVPVVLGTLFTLATILQIGGLEAAKSLLDQGMSAPAALATTSGLGRGVAIATDAVLAVSVYASLLGFINFGSRFLLTLSDDGHLPSKVATISARRRIPVVGVAVMCLGGLAVALGFLFATGDIVLTYTDIAPLFVEFWVLPYILICAAAVVLAARDGKRGGVLMVSALVGGAFMVWLYLNGLTAGGVSGAMSWTALITTAALVAAFAVVRRVSSTQASTPVLGEAG